MNLPSRAGLLLLVLLAGCKAAPLAPVGFVDETHLTAQPDLPFHRAWIDPAVDWQRYRRIQIADVNIDHLSRMDWVQKTGRTEKVKEDAGKLAVYAKQTLERAFREDPARRFEVVDQPDGETIVFEMALVEVIPSKVALNTLGYAPFVGSAARLLRGWKYRSMVAFEARLKDGASGETIAQFADREAEKAAFLNVKDVTWYGHAESILAEWSRQFVQVTSRKPGQTIRDSKPFTLKPW